MEGRTARSSSRSNRTDRNVLGPRCTKNSSGSDRTGQNWGQAWSQGWSWRDDDTWWQRDWRSSSNWHDARVEEDPAEQKEQQAASSHGEAAEPTDGQAVASPQAPESSAGSTSMLPVARQDKRAADVMESGEPTKRSNRPQPKDAIVRKWREWILLQQLLKDLRAAGAAELLADHVARGHYVNHPKCRDVPSGELGVAQLGVLIVVARLHVDMKHGYSVSPRYRISRTSCTC